MRFGARSGGGRGRAHLRFCYIESRRMTLYIHNYGIQEWMLKTPGLDGLCADYLDYIKEMYSGQHDRETIHYFDSQRQVTHNQILETLGLDRSSGLDLEEFARRYLNQ